MRTSQLLKMLAGACVIASLPILTGCETIAGVIGARTEVLPVNDVACRTFARIDPSRADTDGTLAQIHEHNAAYEALCGAEVRP